MHRNICQEKIFATWPKFYKFLSFIKDCIEDMATFTILVKFFSTKFFCSTKVAGLGEIYKSYIQYSNFDTFFPVLVGHVQSCIQPNVIMHRSVHLYQAEAPICFLVAVCSEPYHPHNNVGVVNFYADIKFLAYTTVSNGVSYQQAHTYKTHCVYGEQNSTFIL